MAGDGVPGPVGEARLQVGGEGGKGSGAGEEFLETGGEGGFVTRGDPADLGIGGVEGDLFFHRTETGCDDGFAAEQGLTQGEAEAFEAGWKDDEVGRLIQLLDGFPRLAAEEGDAAAKGIAKFAAGEANVVDALLRGGGVIEEAIGAVAAKVTMERNILGGEFGEGGEENILALVLSGAGGIIKNRLGTDPRVGRISNGRLDGA